MNQPPEGAAPKRKSPTSPASETSGVIESLQMHSNLKPVGKATNLAGMRDQAVALARKGFRVLPLIANSKTPAVEGGCHQASCDPERVRRFWSEALTDEPLDYNIGIATGEGLIVVDIDTKHGKAGVGTWKGLEEHYGQAPQTMTVSTPGRGVHLYFRDGSGRWFPSSAGTLGDGLDIRGVGGYVVAPGSFIDGKAYEAVVDAPIAPIPEWLAQRIEAPKPTKSAGAVEALDGTALDAASARAVDWLRSHAELSIEGQGGNTAAYRVAARVMDFGLSPDDALDLMSGDWNERCEPPWDIQQLGAIVENAAQYRQKPIGAHSADVEFDDVSAEVATDARVKPEHDDMPVTSGNNPFLIEFASDVADTATEQNASPLVEGLLDQGALSMVYAPSNEGKTFVALSLAASVAKGALWAGRETCGGLVVYFATEGGRGIRKRFAAYRQIHGLPAKTPLALIASAADFLSSGVDCSRLIAAVREAERQAGRACVLIVIDTLSRVLAGGDENSSTDMGAIIQRLDSIRSATGSHVMLVHHTGKDSSRGARGWSGLRAAVDTELEVKDQSIYVTKQRDLEFARAIPFSLEGVVIGSDDRGRDITSAVARVGASSVDEFGAELVDGEAEAMAAFKAAAAEKFGEGYRVADDRYFLRTKEWQAQIDGNRSVKGQGLTVARTTWNDRRRILTEKGAVKNIKQGQWVALK